ncbi:MAG: sodium:alanine symporter family protein [Gemmatimonadota bacterium]
MDTLNRIADFLADLVWTSGIPVGEETIPFVVIALLSCGIYFTLRLGFIQVRRFKHGVLVATGRYDKADDTGDVSHFQALSTALSATVGIGNIAGVAIAIHWGGPGALFWMWVTAFLGMATKLVEVTLAQRYRAREVPSEAHEPWRGSVSGGPMYYIENGLGPRWKPLAVIFAACMAVTAFFGGNAVQANTVADVVHSNFGLPVWITGAITTVIVGLVIIGGISRIGRVAGILAPVMAGVYVFAALLVLLFHWDQVLPGLALIVREAFNPTAGVAGTGVGAFLITFMWGVRRGLFSNESGQGSAPIAHAAARTEEPVSEGSVALLEPFIDTIAICTMTALVIIVTASWGDPVPQEIDLASGDLSYRAADDVGIFRNATPPAEIQFSDGRPVEAGSGVPQASWHQAPLEALFLDRDHTQPFTGVLLTGEGLAVDGAGREYASLFAPAVVNGAPLTMLAFRRGLAPIGDFGHYIVLLTVVLFGISSAIAWSYYGDRCANYLFGPRVILPYKVLFIAMHFVGAIVPLMVAWTLGDVFLGIVILPNLLACVLLTGKVKELTTSYFERKPWLDEE